MKGILAAALLAIAPLLAQDLGLPERVPLRDRQFVSYVPQLQTVPAGKRATLDLHFRVAEGFHVNSHTPKSSLLIPTELRIETGEGTPVFPAGSTLSFAFDPAEKLDVYQGAFTVQLPVSATAGEHEMRAILEYQACNRSACFPPRSLPVEIEFIAK